MILGMEPVWRFYLGKVAQEDPYRRPNTVKEMIEKASSQKIEYVLVDYSTLHSKYGAGYTASFLRCVDPIATFLNPKGNSYEYLLDEYGPDVSLSVSGDPSSKHIYIFKVDDIKRSSRCQLP